MDHTVDLQTMLAARDRRAERQRELLGKFGLPMISFTMNIAGPVKNNPLIRRGFQLGRRVLLGQNNWLRRFFCGGRPGGGPQRYDLRTGGRLAAGTAFRLGRARR